MHPDEIQEDCDALHEAGHALVCLASGIPYDDIEVGDRGGATNNVQTRGAPCDTLLLLALIGPAAEAVFWPGHVRTADCRGLPQSSDWCHSWRFDLDLYRDVLGGAGRPRPEH